MGRSWESSKRSGSGSNPGYTQMQQGEFSSHLPPRRPPGRIFDSLPKATVVSVSRLDRNDIRELQLAYTIEIQYKQFKWRLVKKASQVFYLHFALKKRVIIEELQEKQEQIKEWLQSLRIGEHSVVVAEAYGSDDRHEDPSSTRQEEVRPNKSRDVPSTAALPVMRPALGRLPTISERAKSAMQGYLNRFLCNLEIVNSREVCKFLEVSKLSFAPVYGHKLREGFVMVGHLPKIHIEEGETKACSCQWFCCCCNENWQKVWAVLKPGFLAFLADPFDTNPLDIIMFDVLAPSEGNGDGMICLAKLTKEHNLLHFGFMVMCSNREVRIRTSGAGKARDWVAAINDTGLRPPEGWCHPHRFGSFSPPRGLTADGSEAQWFVDANAAFEAISFAIQEAKSEIFIAGWWVCPELYIRRPYDVHPASRLDTMLEAKAKQGVQIYVLLYKEVALALKINSFYTKQRLLSIHENVKVLRYPDHFSAGVYLWSHHEKIVIVDNAVCFLGGLDLCFGRYDTPEHRLNDYPPTIWPGKDYYNPRESEPNSWEDAMKDEMDRLKFPRMPWHDVHCALWGPPCNDVARHFVQRWNYAKRNKAPHEQAIPLLLPHYHMVIPHYLTGDEKRDSISEVQEVAHLEVRRLQPFSSQSLSEDIPLLLPKQNGMQMRGFVDDQDERRLQRLMNQVKESPNNGWWEWQERAQQVGSREEVGQVGPRIACHCQVLRSVGQWSAGTSQIEETSILVAYCSLIEKAEHFIYIENQFFISGLNGDDVICNRVLQALYSRIVRAHNEKQCFRVIVVMPLMPGFQGGVDDAGAASVRAIMHWQYRAICRGKHSLLESLYDVLGPIMHEYVSFYGLRNYGRLYEDGPLVTNQIYVHSKIMIVDDRAVLIGSANLNDRSLLGSRDSEVAVLIEDKEFIDSFMNQEPWRAGRFSLGLRMSLWSEHLGLQGLEVDFIKDPISESTYRNLWMTFAEMNTTIYQDVFGCIPNDLIRSRVALRQAISRQKEKIGHTTIDLGVALDKLECLQDEDTQSPYNVDKLLGAIKGHLVCFPLEFMREEDLRPMFNESEYYASPQVFH